MTFQDLVDSRTGFSLRPNTRVLLLRIGFTDYRIVVRPLDGCNDLAPFAIGQPDVPFVAL